MKGTFCAFACLPAGFGLAQLTGVRPLGGILLVALAALAGRWSPARGRRIALWYGVVAVCFVASHLLGHAIGAWAAVAVVTAIATAAYELTSRASRTQNRARHRRTPNPRFLV